MIKIYRPINYFLTIIILCFSNFLFAQNNLINKIPNQVLLSNVSKDTSIKSLPNSKATFRTKQLISEFNKIRFKKKYQSDTNYNEIKSEFLIKNINAIDYISAFIQLVDEKYIDTLESLGVKIVGPKQKLIIGLIPIEKVILITEMPFIVKIEVGSKVSKHDLTTNKLTKSDSVQKGVQLPQSYTGKNVIVGIIDGGFDYTHPNFYDSTGKIYRIKAIWDQSDKTGTSNVSSLPFGSMYYDSLKIISQNFDIVLKSLTTLSTTYLPINQVYQIDSPSVEIKFLKNPAQSMSRIDNLKGGSIQTADLCKMLPGSGKDCSSIVVKRVDNFLS
jgi:hypothetical protein